MFAPLRATVLSASLAIGACASQTEMVRLQGQADELRKQLAYEKQRLRQAAEKSGSNASGVQPEPPCICYNFNKIK